MVSSAIGPSGNIISTNAITDNDVGIELSGYSNNFISHNNFVDNTATVYRYVAWVE